MKFFLFLSLLIFSNISFAELLKPSDNLEPQEVISIQLNALQNNDIPFKNAGIEQTWEFAHPSNRVYTGPLNNFIKMMYSSSYVIMLNHLDHNIILISKEDDLSYFFIELIDKTGIKYGFKWTVKKVYESNIFKNCWMTIGVSPPIQLSESA